MFNRTTFFAYVRKLPFGGRLTQKQVEGMNAILDEWERRPELTDLRWLAYMLATVFRETGARMQPVRETFATSDAQAIRRLEHAWKSGKLPWVSKPYWRDGGFGRGLVQITHLLPNYDRMGDILGIDLVHDPDLALRMDIAIDIMFEGMTRGESLRGDFTGVSLEDYFNDKTDDPVGARKIINGTDKAKLIAGYHRSFLDALQAAVDTYKPERTTDYIAPDVTPAEAEPDDIEPRQSKTLWGMITALLGGGGFTISGLIGSVDNVYALGALIAVLIVAGLGAWLIVSGRVQFVKPGKAIT